MISSRFLVSIDRNRALAYLLGISLPKSRSRFQKKREKSHKLYLNPDHRHLLCFSMTPPRRASGGRRSPLGRPAPPVFFKE
ncbi:hypothetical protein BRADI_3g22335v3 [Brachypodium distachyon]|uniref:Uncharacterized protein n=1 Tax=Brachypodium distachyon TaxID=15368 RepID=A0A2K2CYT0_BRADI|nr:hypothetical protein BRADI_3g22335v3 [Brachypodium distachyon]